MESASVGQESGKLGSKKVMISQGGTRSSVRSREASGITLNYGALVMLMITIAGAAWQLSSDISALGARIDGVEKQMVSLEKQMNSRADGLEKQMLSLEKQVNSRIDSFEKQVNSRIDGLEGRMDGLEGRMDGLERRMDSLESEARETNKFLREKIIQSSQETSATSSSSEGYEFDDGIHHP